MPDGLAVTRFGKRRTNSHLWDQIQRSGVLMATDKLIAAGRALSEPSDMPSQASPLRRFLAKSAANFMMSNLSNLQTRAFRKDQFRAWLPGLRERHAIDGAQRPGAVPPNLKLEGKRIIVVEDEALLALDLQFACEDEGAQVIGPAMSLDQALAKLENSPAIDGAILDVDLCGRDVYPVAALLRDRGVPFVFHTGHGSHTRLAELFPGSVTCSKPTSPDTLIDTLLSVMV